MEIKRKRILYHVTPPDNVERIIREGLKPGGNERRGFAVYLSEKPLSWWTDGLVILKVDVSGLKEVKATTFLPESDEILFWGEIPAWKITKEGFKNRISIYKDCT